jgi:hypothetical protein
MSMQMSVDEIITVLNMDSRLLSVLVEGPDDIEWFDRIEPLIGKKANVIPCGGRPNLLKIFRRRPEFFKVPVAFIADRDIWVFTEIPAENAGIIFTWGYSIENDLIQGLDLHFVLADKEAQLREKLALGTRDWATEVRKRLLEERPAVDRSIDKLIGEIQTQLIQKSKGKTCGGFFNDLHNSVSSNHKKFWDIQLNESHQPWMRLVREARSCLGLA